MAVADARIGSEAWYAVWTQSHYEHIVSQQLSAKGFDAFLPQMSVWSKRNSDMRLIRVPMFPGYLFVRDTMEKRSYIEILKARGVVRILDREKLQAASCECYEVLDTFYDQIMYAYGANGAQNKANDNNA